MTSRTLLTYKMVLDSKFQDMIQLAIVSLYTYEQPYR